MTGRTPIGTRHHERALAMLLLSLGACSNQYPELKGPATDWCLAGDQNNVAVCIDLAGDGAEIISGPSRNVFTVNTGLVVYVRHPSSSTVKATLAGKEAVAALTPNVPTAQSPSRNPRALKEVEDGGTQDASAVPPALVMSTFRFSPRAAGDAPLTITWTPQQAGKTPDGGPSQITLDLQVESVNWGAVRLGVGTVFGNAVSPSYELRSFAGSSQSEVALSDKPNVGFEGILGVAPYVLDIVACPGHGRSFTGGCNFYVAPYVGFGILGQSATGVQSFDGIYLGGEIAFSSTYSIALTWVDRRITELSSGYSEGSPANVGTQFTRTGSGRGFGLILNITPDFFSFSTPAKTPSGEGGQGGKGGGQ